MQTRCLATFPRALTRFLGRIQPRGEETRPQPSRAGGRGGGGGWPGRHLPAEAEAPGASRHRRLRDLAPSPAPPRIQPIRAEPSRAPRPKVAAEAQPRLLRGLSPPDGTESPLRCPGAAGRRRGTPGRSTLATREPAPQHKAAAAQVSAAEPREPVNAQGPSHGRPLRAPLPQTAATLPPTREPKRGRLGEQRKEERGWARPETTAVRAPHLRTLGPAAAAPPPCAPLPPPPPPSAPPSGPQPAPCLRPPAEGDPQPSAPQAPQPRATHRRLP